MSDKSKPAFPQVQCRDEEGRFSPIVIEGMTLREYYAGLAMAARISNAEIGIDETADEVAVMAIEQADALIAELQRDGTDELSRNDHLDTSGG